MIIVTGGSGFIGSNLIRKLNQHGEETILLVDPVTPPNDLKILEHLKPQDLLKLKFPDSCRGVFHQGACSNTLESDRDYLMANNYEYSKQLLELCLRSDIPFIYASSASVYGSGANGFRVSPECENPLNFYAESKWLFDQHVRKQLGKHNSQIVGLRYFNVYGPGETHKGPMASMVHQLTQQLKNTGKARLFTDGEQKRDFIHVDDVVKINLWFLEHPEHSGIFNAGTGQAQSFNHIAKALIAQIGHGDIEYFEFPPQLKNSYQAFTRADLSGLRAIGYNERLPIL